VTDAPWVQGEIVEYQSLANGERTLRAVVQRACHGADVSRVIVRDPKMRYAQVVRAERLRRPRGVPTLCGPGAIA
jgi:hypothetical protein